MATSVTRQRVTNISLLEYANRNRDQGFFSDVIIAAGNERIPANRLVLSCYSTYFEGMFKLPMRERYEKIIEVKTIDGRVLRALIDFIYVGSINIDEQNVMNLLSGADYLQLHDVKEFCFEFLHSHITVDNSLGILKTADLYRNESLKNEMLQYISINLEKVLQTDDFKQLSTEELITRISKLDRCQVKESLIFEAIATWCNHGKKARETKFPSLFKMVQLRKVPIDYLEEVILEEELVVNAADCHKIALSAFRTLVKEQTAKPQASKVLSFGGGNCDTKVTVVYDLNSETSLSYPDLPEKLQGHCSLMLNDYIYCIGGDNKNRPYSVRTNSVLRLNSKKQTSDWEQVAPMNKKRGFLGAAVYGDVIVVAGGEDENKILLVSTEVYQTSFNEWRIISALKQQRSSHALVSCDGYLYAIGGWSGSNFLSSVERLDDLKGEWINTKTMQTPRGAFAAVNCDGLVYAMGGRFSNQKSSTLKTVEKYDPSTNKWKYVSNMNFKRCAHAACALRNKIYVVGGLDADGKVVTQIECYDPTHDTWSIVGNTTEKFCWHTVIAV